MENVQAGIIYNPHPNIKCIGIKRSSSGLYWVGVEYVYNNISTYIMLRTWNQVFAYIDVMLDAASEVCEDHSCS
ncbi:hypothetical protein LCGC14_1636880 [marine sediment metagenome]|uniref:Uncharacterized protein n=1 Tax=marine sediment metagenome TaxID=412755 RepID=A0A0F9IN91_9ZZZZ